MPINGRMGKPDPAATVQRVDQHSHLLLPLFSACSSSHTHVYCTSLFATDDLNNLESHSDTPLAMSPAFVMWSTLRTTSKTLCTRKQMPDNDHTRSRAPFVCVTMPTTPSTSKASCTIPELLNPWLPSS
ncbi:hypothetical protein BD410DRAFT_796361 [Rickenella mellea]|uniref:Uncharacterized protein n=1 Tax=Rickenella mellea TaxID=50990 RepID=A0A4Y7PJ56_9AGAM|nr:hypothetical protein BD410DRAFT_796361 [Rickenella mellea]